MGEFVVKVSGFNPLIGWSPSWYLGPVRPSSAFSCPSCWKMPKFSPITAYMHDVLHWLPISQRIQYHITALVSRCVLHCALLTFVILLPSVGFSSVSGAPFYCEG